MKTQLILGLMLVFGTACPGVVGAGNSGADKPFSVGDIVYIHAFNGLTLRQTGAKDGAKIALLPYNAAPMTVMALPDPAVQQVAETIGSFTVGGGWVKVKTREGQEGYLFEGYLSRYPPAIETPEQGKDAVDWFYQTIAPHKGKRITLPSIDGSIEHYSQAYADGARFDVQVYPGGSTQLLDLPVNKFTMEEALVLFRPVWFAKELTTGRYDPAKQLLEIMGISGYYQFTIQPKGNQLRLRFAAAD